MKDGEYALQILDKQLDFTPSARVTGKYGDFSISVVARMMQAEDNFYVYLGLRKQEGAGREDGSGHTILNRDYRFCFYPESGRVRLFYWPDSGAEALDSSQSDDLVMGTAPFVISATCVGNSLVAMVDGETVASARHDAYSRGELRIGTGRIRGTTSLPEARFKDLLVVQR